MTFWRGRRCRAAVPSALRAGGAGLFAAVALAVPGLASTAAQTDDPRDAGVRLDLKALTHARNGGSIVLTAETYAPFSDEAALFKWGLDRDRDEDFDLLVSTEWRDGKLAGWVQDPSGQQIAPASVSRPGPAAISVSFPAGLLGDVSVYRYAVRAGASSGEGDLAPDSGLVQHRLGPGPLPAEARTASSSPPAKASSATANSAPAGASAPAAAAAAAATAQPPTVAQENLPRTGPTDRRFLLALAGAAFATGGVLIGMRGPR